MRNQKSNNIIFKLKGCEIGNFPLNQNSKYT